MYTDEKGRTRWHVNDQIGAKLKQLGEYLIIGGYDEGHAARYGQLAYTISRYPEPLDRLAQEGRIRDIPGVGQTIEEIVQELLATGATAKMERAEFGFVPPPLSVLELTAIPRLGVKTVRMLYQEYGIDSLDSLQHALEVGALTEVKGFGPKTMETIRRYLRDRA